MPKHLVAIVGRPNVGKSTLFNRLVGQRLAIVSDIPGTTRDRIAATVFWNERSFMLVDTGGLEVQPTSDLWEKVKAQVEMAVEEADAIIFLTDVVEGLTPGDREIAQSLRQREKPLLLVVNKVDNIRREQLVAEFYELGLGDPLPISAHHNLGIEDMLLHLDSLLTVSSEDEDEAEMLKLAIRALWHLGEGGVGGGETDTDDGAAEDGAL